MCTIMALCAGCGSPAVRIDQRAEHYRLARTEIAGDVFRHVAYLSRGSGTTLFLFIDGDGRPHANSRAPTSDPTTHEPLALDLVAQTPAPAAYLARPCHELITAACEASLWTSARYSAAVVSSMASAAEQLRRSSAAEEFIIVGFSGGGVLAVLMAERLEHVRAVITLGANLDVSAWEADRAERLTTLLTTLHTTVDTHDDSGPLHMSFDGSLNPAQSERPHPWFELHLQGAQDIVVPPPTTQRYFTRYPQAHKRVYAEFDHTCCWVREWPATLADLMRMRDLPAR